MNTAIDVTFLTRLCRQGQPESKLSQPWSTTIDGEPWAWASDGYHLVALRTQSLLQDGAECSGLNIEAAVWPIPQGQPVRLADLKAFAGAPTWPDPDAKATQVRCGDCRGKGVIDGFCHSCGREEDEECKSCDGTGKVEEEVPLWPERRYGNIGVAQLDLEHVARCLDAFTDETVQLSVRGPIASVYFHTPDWVVMVMPLRSTEAEFKAAKSFEFQANPAEAVPS